MTSTTTSPAPRPGVFARFRTLLAGSRDPVDAQLAEIERQGAALSRLAHTAAFCLIVLFSIGSLLGLSHDALITLQQQWQATHTVNLTSALAAAVNGFLVLVMDTALIYSASILRIIKARQGAEGGAVHVLVMIGVSIIEGATWAYFSSIYDRPHDPIAWSLIGGRAVAAPLLSAYLSLARPIPVGPGDILYQAAMASGKGVIRDVTREANDEHAPLARKATIYRAAALMHPAERARLDQLIEAAQQDHQQQPEPSRTPDPIAQIPAPSPAPAVLPFAGRSDHIASGETDLPDPETALAPLSPGAMPDEAPDRDHRVFTLNLVGKRPAPQAGRLVPRQPLNREQLKRRRLAVARRILAADPNMGLRELTRQIAMATRYRISESTAAKLRDEVRAQDQEGTRDADAMN